MNITDAWATAPAHPPGPPAPPCYVLSRLLFIRLLGVVYFVAFVSLAVQVSGLVGANGILPAGAFLERAHGFYGGAAYRLFPTLCWFSASDGMLRALCWGGAALAALLVAGVAQAPVLLLLWVCYLSLSVAGQTFLWFQWDGLLLETGLVALLYAPIQLLPSRAEPAPSPLARWLVWWLLFRLMFLSGITKLASGDPTWRGLTALDYHFWTQPLPTPLAWYAHWAPVWLHRAMTLAILVMEVLVPWLIVVAGRWGWARRGCCGLMVAGQLAIALTGNYGFFNLLAVALCISLLDDRLLERIVPLRLTPGPPDPRWKDYAIRGLAPVLALLTLLAFAREIAQTLPNARGALDNPLLAAVEPLRSVNGYGLFRVMTTDRPEIVIEGSRDSLHWREYGFRWKPGDLLRRPAFVAPHMPRLDWQMWFAALDPERARDWLASLLQHLLSGTPAVVALLGSNPFPDAPPRYVRLVSYRYRFTTPAERSRSGAWWEREFVGYLTRPLSVRTASRFGGRPLIFPPHMKATDIRRGHVILIDGQPCRVMEFTHRTPGNLRAFVQVRLRNLVTGNTFDTRLAATDFMDEAPLETKEFQVLYRDQGGVHVMDTTTYDQHTLDDEATGDHADWLQPEMHIQVEWLDGRPVGIELPSVVELTVTQTSPVMRGATKTSSTKPAKLSNGVTIQVPDFIAEGDKVRVDPREGVYLERAK